MAPIPVQSVEVILAIVVSPKGPGVEVVFPVVLQTLAVLDVLTVLLKIFQSYENILDTWRYFRPVCRLNCSKQWSCSPHTPPPLQPGGRSRSHTAGGTSGGQSRPGSDSSWGLSQSLLVQGNELVGSSRSVRLSSSGSSWRCLPAGWRPRGSW